MTIKRYNKKTNPHPRGWFGEMLANDLLEAGWTEETVGIDAHVWVSPKGEMVGRIEWAHERWGIAKRLEIKGGDSMI